MNVREALTGLARLTGVLATVATERRRRPRKPELPGLGAPVTVEHDRWGVPHIYGRSQEDVFAVQGYLHGKDRLWQLELQRRLGQGRLAELFGPSAVDGDRLARTLGLAELARRAVTTLRPATAEATSAYVRGINAAIRHEPRPIEFRLLGVRAEPWTEADVLTWTATMALTLSENWTAEALRARIAGLLGEPVPPEDVPGRLKRFRWAAADVTGVRPRTGRGSNAWAVDARHTGTGSALLACDPHLGVSVPGVWYENHLSAPGFEVTGAALPGAPGVVIGHNADIAWGVTNARVDVQDLYREQLDKTGERYRTPGGWADLETRRATIEVRGAAAHVEQIRATTHGPLITDFLGAEVATPGEVVALKWAGPAPGGVLDSVLALNQARDWDGFLAALAGWTSPAQNFVYADVTGRAGVTLAGTVPVRARGAGELPARGWTGEEEWIGELDPAERPAEVDPPDGLVVSANTRLFGTSGAPLAGEWVADYRADRIRALLRETSRHDVASFARMQADVHSIPGVRLAALAARLPVETGAERAAHAALVSWDGGLTADSVAGAVYTRLRHRLVTAAYADVAGALALNPGGGVLRWQPGRDFLEMTGLPLVLDRIEAGDDAWLGGGRDWASVLAGAWRSAVADLLGEFGPDPRTWRYGRSHRITLRHPFGVVRPLGGLLNRGPFPLGGDQDTVCAGHLVPDSDGEPSFSGATYRMVCDPGDWDRSRSVLPTGQSGRPGSAHYLDQTGLWRRGELHPMPWTRAAVARLSARRTVFAAAERGGRGR